MTPAEYLALPEEKPYLEYVDGMVMQKPRPSKIHSMLALRIGYFARERPDPDAVSAAELAAWLSPRDAAELVRAAVEAEDLDFVVVNGTSANRYRRADLEDTIRRLGYQPTEDAW